MPPLDNLKVIDLTRVLAGPFCAMLLGDMGADVIKIEEPAAGDDARGWAPFVGDWSAYFLGVNRSKRSLALDLKQPGAPEVLRRLLAGADVFIENFKPGSLDKLGFGYEQTRALNPRLVHCSISGYGKNGPRRHLSGYDPIVQAESGFMDITGTSRRPAVRTGIAMTDYLAGLYAFGGILLALRDRDRTGRGQHVDIALYDSVLSTLSMPAGILQATGRNPRRMGNDHAAIAPYETLRAKDGTVMIAAANPRLWKQLCAAVGVPHLADDPRFRTNTDRVRNRAELKVELERAFAPYTVAELARGSGTARRCRAGRCGPCPKPSRIRRSTRGRCSSASTIPSWTASRSSAIRSSSRTTRACRPGVPRSLVSTPARFCGSLATATQR